MIVVELVGIEVWDEKYDKFLIKRGWGFEKNVIFVEFYAVVIMGEGKEEKRGGGRSSPSMNSLRLCFACFLLLI